MSSVSYGLQKVYPSASFEKRGQDYQSTLYHIQKYKSTKELAELHHSYMRREEDLCDAIVDFGSRLPDPEHTPNSVTAQHCLALLLHQYSIMQDTWTFLESLNFHENPVLYINTLSSIEAMLEISKRLREMVEIGFSVSRQGQLRPPNFGGLFYFTMHFRWGSFLLQKAYFGYNESMKQNLWIVGGGDTFTSTEKYLHFLENGPLLDWMMDSKKTGDWKKWLADGLFDTHNTIKIPMIDKTNAKYEAWKMIFERFCDELDTNIPISLIGHSLGGIFLAKYLSENKFPTHIQALHLVAPVWTYPDSELHNTASFSFDPDNLKNLLPQCRDIHIWASTDDEIVNYEDAEKYHAHLDGSTLHSFSDRGHFIGSHFVELFTTLLPQ